MTSKPTSFLPSEEALGRNLINFETCFDSSDNLSLKSCPALRLSRAKMIANKPQYGSSSSLSDIREYYPLQSKLRKDKDPPDKPLKKDVETSIESEWKRRTRQVIDLTDLQSLARKQQAEELNFEKEGHHIEGIIELDISSRTSWRKVSKNGTTVNRGSAKHTKNRSSYHTPIIAKSLKSWDMASLSSKSCTTFGDSQPAQSFRQGTWTKTSKSAHDDVVEPACVARTPALGVQELKRRFSARAKMANASEENAVKGMSKLTQTSFTDVRSSEPHLPLKYTPHSHKQKSPRGTVEARHRSWNARVTEKEITQVAGFLYQEKQANQTPQIVRQHNMTSSGSTIFDNASHSSEELRKNHTSHFTHDQYSTDVSHAFSTDIIPPPPEFDYEFLQASSCRSDSAVKPTNESYEQPLSVTRQAPLAEDPDAENATSKRRRPVSAKASFRATSSCCTQTGPGVRPGRRRRCRRVTYSPSEVSGPSDRPEEDQWCVDSGRRRRPSRRAARRSRGEEALPRTAGSRPVSGRSSQAAASRPVSGRCHAAPEVDTRPTLVQEVHRKAKDQKAAKGGTRKRAKRNVLQVPKNMPEAISRFLEQLSKDKEAIRVIHKMSLVVSKK